VSRPRPRPWRRLAPTTGALVVLGLGLLPGCELPGFGAPDPASEEGESIFSLWQGFFLAAIGVAALVWGLLVYVLLRYRRRRGDGDGDDDLPSQKPYNIPMEVFYTATPVVVVALLFGFSVATEQDVTGLRSDPDVVVEVVGFQWSWQFRYPDEDVSIDGEPGQPPEMVLPVGRTTRLRLVASDVAHSFWVPDFLSKRDLIPGVDNEIDVTPTEEGSFTGRCAEYCGLDHWQMYFSVRVVSQSEYEDWLAEQQADDAEGPTTTEPTSETTGTTGTTTVDAP
jgi:cytochrome c oxidase subunit II